MNAQISTERCADEYDSRDQRYSASFMSLPRPLTPTASASYVQHGCQPVVFCMLPEPVLVAQPLRLPWQETAPVEQKGGCGPRSASPSATSSARRANRSAVRAAGATTSATTVSLAPLCLLTGQGTTVDAPNKQTRLSNTPTHRFSSIPHWCRVTPGLRCSRAPGGGYSRERIGTSWICR